MRIKWLFLLLILNCLLGAESAMNKAVVIAMCRPHINQIKNIESLYEKDLLPLDKMTLLCIYHENETTDYRPAFQYVQDNGLSWVEFRKIEGRVELPDMFKENLWTPQFKEIFERTDGIIFTGGDDIPPRIYGEENNLLTSATTPVRSMYEISFLFHLLGGSQNPDFSPFLNAKENYAVLGLCLGCQSMNVAAGGTLYQDIPSQIYGLTTMEEVLRLEPDSIHTSQYVKMLHPLETTLAPAFHRIRLLENSKFVREMNMKESDTPYVLTSHHQAIHRFGKNLAVAALAMDGRVVEAIEHEKYKNVLGVQFHPEYYQLYQKGAFFKEKPGDRQEFNLRFFLKDNPPSLQFHYNLWAWFANAALAAGEDGPR